MIIKKNCLNCKKEISELSKYQNYCNTTCVNNHRKTIILPPKKCIVCGIDFKNNGLHPNRKFCSKKCCFLWHDKYNEARLIKKKEYIEKNKSLINQRRILAFNEWKMNGRKTEFINEKLEPISDEAEQVLLGSLLGDGNLSLTFKKKVRYSESHCLKQAGYLAWKKEILSELNPTKIYHFDKKDVFYIHNKRLYPYYKLFYPNHKKELSIEILDRLKPLGLAIWYMDDGNYDKNSARISCSLLNETFIQAFYKKFNILPKLDKHGLRFNIRESNEFIKLLKEFIHKDLYYKIDIEGNRKAYQEYRDRHRIRINEYYKNYRREKICPKKLVGNMEKVQNIQGIIGPETQRVEYNSMIDV